MIDALPESLRRAVSPYTGIVRSVEECLWSTSEPALFQASCEVGRGEQLLGSGLVHLTGMGGSGRTRSAAAAAAVGEALERYSATYVPPERIVVATARELGPAAVPPEAFALFSEEQYGAPHFPFRRFTADTEVRWVEGRDLVAERPAFLPAELVYLGNTWMAPGPIGYTTSSGLACGAERDETLLRGLLELLERDAFMIVWANRLPLRRLEPDDTVPPGWRQAFDRTGLVYTAVDLSVFHRLPTVLGIVRASRQVPGALGVGASAAPTIEQAWWKALAEAFATRSAAAKLQVLDPTRRFGPHGTGVESFEDHILYYATHANVEATAFLDRGSGTTLARSVTTLEGRTTVDRIDSLTRRIAAAGSGTYAVDVTAPDIAELGLTVTRVVAPGLCPLDVSHAQRFLGGRRLYEAAAELGLRSGALAAKDVNPDPHPFP